MTHGPEHHLEEAEHAQHAAHDPFDRRVAMTMTIVAAMLACVTMLSHRAHNQTLQNQIKSNDNITERANIFAYYHAKKNRQLAAEGLAESFDIKAEESKTATKEKAKKSFDKWTANARKWKADSQKLETKGHKLGENIKKYAEESHKYHQRANFFDAGELGVEFGLILCTIAVLTKLRPFWFSGMAAAGLGFAVALSGFVVPPPHEEHPKEEAEGTAWVIPKEHSQARRGGSAVTTSLDERIDAQRDKDAAQHRHQHEAHAADALVIALGEESAEGSRQAKYANHRSAVHGVLEQTILQGK
jgi:hypothetical protein